MPSSRKGTLPAALRAAGLLCLTLAALCLTAKAFAILPLGARRISPAADTGGTGVPPPSFTPKVP
jgi:hypothetical protein